MKKIFVVFLFSLMLLSGTISSVAVDVYVNNQKVVFTDSTGYPFIDHNNRTMVPLRVTMEALGADVLWDGAEHCAIVRKDSTTVNCYIGESCIYRNSTRIENDTQSIIRNSRTFLPIRAVAEALDATVTWDGSVHISLGGAENLIYSIENSGLHVSNLWKSWEEALSNKDKGYYYTAIEKIKALAPDFLNANDGVNDAILYKHLGECYGALEMTEHAAACFKREAECWASVHRYEEEKNALQRSAIISPTVQIYAKTFNDNYKPRKYFGVRFEPENGIYLGAYAEGDKAVHEPYYMTRFYTYDFPDLVGKDMASYILYMPSDYPLSFYKTHIDIAAKENKIIQLTIEPVNLYATKRDDPTYIKLAKDMEKSDADFILRFACEMNEKTCPWYTTDYEAYIEKFRIVADIFHKYAPSVPVMWSPNFYPDDNIHLYYPGDDYVDYVGISSYKHYQPYTDPLGEGVDRSRWSDQLDTICSLFAHKKPIIVSEGGASYRDHATGGDITSFASEQLYDFYTYLPIKYPSVKAVYIFDANDTNFKFLLSDNKQYLSAFKKGIASEQYLQIPYNRADLPQYYELGNNTTVEARTTEISSFVKTSKNDISYVVYNINGTDVATAYDIPYSVKIDFSPYQHTISLKAMAFDSRGIKVAEKTYKVKVV